MKKTKGFLQVYQKSEQKYQNSSDSREKFLFENNTHVLCVVSIIFWIIKRNPNTLSRVNRSCTKNFYLFYFFNTFYLSRAF
jgi:hypothetical protein